MQTPRIHADIRTNSSLEQKVYLITQIFFIAFKQKVFTNETQFKVNVIMGYVRSQLRIKS